MTHVGSELQIFKANWRVAGMVSLAGSAETEAAAAKRAMNGIEVYIVVDYLMLLERCIEQVTLQFSKKVIQCLERKAVYFCLKKLLDEIRV